LELEIPIITTFRFFWESQKKYIDKLEAEIEALAEIAKYK
jgi:hypothetical protein